WERLCAPSVPLLLEFWFLSLWIPTLSHLREIEILTSGLCSRGYRKLPASSPAESSSRAGSRPTACPRGPGPAHGCLYYSSKTIIRRYVVCFHSFRASPSDMKRSSKKGMEFKLQLAALVRSKIEGGKLKLELHAFFRSFRAAPTRHGGPLIKIIIRIAIDFLRRAA